MWWVRGEPFSAGCVSSTLTGRTGLEPCVIHTLRLWWRLQGHARRSLRSHRASLPKILCGSGASPRLSAPRWSQQASLLRGRLYLRGKRIKWLILPLHESETDRHLIGLSG